jgi:hypothetical protein
MRDGFGKRLQLAHTAKGLYRALSQSASFSPWLPKRHLGRNLTGQFSFRDGLDEETAMPRKLIHHSVREMPDQIGANGILASGKVSDH